MHLIEFACLICKQHVWRSPTVPWAPPPTSAADQICFDCFAATFSKAAHRPVRILVIAANPVKPEAGSWATRDDQGHWRIGLKNGHAYDSTVDLVNEEFGCAYKNARH